MPIKFTPVYRITPKIARSLIQIEAARQKALHLPLTPMVLSSLRETAKLYTTHYSTMIEGNQLSVQQVEKVLKHQEHFPGRQRDEREIKAYYTALQQVEQWAARGAGIEEPMIRHLHALVMGDGRNSVKPSPYRDGQNVIQNARSREIVYMSPEAKDVPALMHALVEWIRENSSLPCPLVASIVHYQFATIHPYYDGNGRTARLLTTLTLYLGGYDLKGLYSLEEYYARNLPAYYEAISIGPSHNYYLGRAEADITAWIEYFIEGMAVSFEKVLTRMEEAGDTGSQDQAMILRKLDPKQRKALELFQTFETVTSSQIGELFGFKPRTASQLCKKWVDAGFLEIVDSSKKGRKYGLSKNYRSILESLSGLPFHRRALLRNG